MNPITYLFRGGCVAMTMLLAMPVFAQSPTPPGAESAGGAVVVRGTIRNGTTGRRQQVEELRLIRLQGGMQVLQIIADAGPDFSFEPVPGDAPLLLRASYEGTSYTKMIPPAPRFQRQAQELEVFEGGADRGDITITPLIQLVNTREGLQVSRVYAIENDSDPPRAYKGDPSIFIPSEATNVNSQLRNPGSQMPAPIALIKDGDFSRTSRGFRPGRSLLSIDFTLPNRELVDRNPAGAEATAIVLWQPAAARPEITGATSEFMEIPEQGPAFRVRYPAHGEVRFQMNDSDFYFENPAAAHENAFLSDAGRTGIALVIALAFLFLMISLLTSLLRGSGSGSTA